MHTFFIDCYKGTIKIYQSPKFDLSLKKWTNVSKNDIKVEGIDDIKVNIAGCCKPVPGDEIIGYISKGYGINIHRLNCPNVSELEERFIPVSWQDNVGKKYETDILVRAYPEKNILVDIVSKTIGNEVIIQNVSTYESAEENLYKVVVLTPNLDKLKKFMVEVNKIPTVFDVERSIK